MPRAGGHRAGLPHKCRLDPGRELRHPAEAHHAIVAAGAFLELDARFGNVLIGKVGATCPPRIRSGRGWIPREMRIL